MNDKDNCRLGNIVLVEHSPDYARFVTDYLTRRGYSVDHVDRLSLALTRIPDELVDVVLLDLNLPDSRGIETLRTVHRQAPEIPVVVVTGTGDEVSGIQAVQCGAQDYLVKEALDPAELERAMIYAVERKRFETAMCSCQDRPPALRSNLEASAISRLEDGVFVEVNAGFCDITGYGEEELLGRMSRELGFWPQARERELFSAALSKDGMVRAWPMTIRTRSGEDRYVILSADRFSYAGEQRVLSILTDVTDRMQAERNLRESEETFGVLFEHTAEACYLADFRGTVKTANTALEILTGYSREELVGTGLAELDIIAGGQKPRAARLLARSTVGAATDPESFLFTRKDGSSVRVQLRTFVVQSSGGPLLLGMVRDLSDRVQVLRRERQSQKMETIGHFTGGIAHDFNNLLSVIMGNIELVRDSAQNDMETPMSAIRDLENATRRATEMTRQLLDFSREAELELRPVSLNDLVRNLGSTIRRLLPKDIGIEMLTGGADRCAVADCGAVERMLVNLATNARDAMSGRGRLTIGVEDVDLDERRIPTSCAIEPGPFVCVSVTDTGSGMDSTTLAQFFDPFYTTKPVGHGTGLGMAMVHGLIKQHHGFVDVSSELGVGTTIRLYFPATDSAPPTCRPLANDPCPGGTETILLVENDPPLRRTAKRLLEHVGYRVLTAFDGQDGIETYQGFAERIDMVIAETTLPKKGGAELWQALCAEPETPKFMLLAGWYSARELRERGDMDEVPLLRTPWTGARLLEFVRRTLDGIDNEAPVSALAQDNGAWN